MNRILIVIALLTAVGLTAGFGFPAAVQNPSKPTLASLSWMAGQWTRVTEKETLEETWGSPIGDAMVGMFRWVKKGKNWLYELICIEAEGDSIVFRLRHFNRGLVPWKSEKEPLTYTLTRAGKNEVVFENPDRDRPRRFVYRRTGNVLVVRIEGPTGEGQEFRLQKRTDG